MGRRHLAADAGRFLSSDAIADRVCGLGRLPHRGWGKKDANGLGADDIEVIMRNYGGDQ